MKPAPPEAATARGPTDKQTILPPDAESNLVAPPESLARALMDAIRLLESCVVAFSGGVDSSVVAAAAWRTLGERASAVTAVSSSLAREQQETAARVAAEIGIPHRFVETREVQDPLYIRNQADRCYHCKSHLYTTLRAIASESSARQLVSGTNADDLGDYRPGIAAGNEHQVRAPLAELGFGKSEVRHLARYFGLSVSEAPASPCLSSRIAYGETVTPEKLRRIDEAESWLRRAGFATCRVRYHAGDLARIEVTLQQLPELLSTPLLDQFRAFCHGLGFRFVTVDLDGFRSGNLNRLISIETFGSRAKGQDSAGGTAGTE